MHNYKIDLDHLSADIFRAYDIRGIFNEDLNEDVAYAIGRSIGSEALKQQQLEIIVGFDGRLSSPVLSKALIHGLLDSGVNIINVGMVPTPVTYFASFQNKFISCVMLTGSHNPPNYNGFKIMLDGNALSGKEITSLYTRLIEGNLTQGSGTLIKKDILQEYSQYILHNTKIKKKIKAVVDCGNGVTGLIAPKLLQDLGVDVYPLYTEVDGNFPGHHPDPAKIENLQDAILHLKKHDCDLVLAFDGDGDRVGVVTKSGQMVYTDRLMMLFARDILQRNPGAEIIYDVKCTKMLALVINQYGGKPTMWKTGHSLIKKKMRETNSLFAGEMSGHIFFKERWFGFDDGLYSAVRLLEILSDSDRTLEEMLEGFPKALSTPEINIKTTDTRKFEIIHMLQQETFAGFEVTTMDGVRVDSKTGFALIRASNTTPVLVLRFEAEDEQELEQLQMLFKQKLQNIAPEINIPF